MRKVTSKGIAMTFDEDEDAIVVMESVGDDGGLTKLHYVPSSDMFYLEDDSISHAEFEKRINKAIATTVFNKISQVFEEKEFEIDEDLSRYGNQSKLLIYEKDILKDLKSELEELFNKKVFKYD